jgi:aryl sulfotransferase
MAVSLYHQSTNIDHERLRHLTGQWKPDAPAASRSPLREWLLKWIDDDVTPGEQLDSLPGIMWHLSGAWARRTRPNIVLMHYDELFNDLDGAMRRLANILGITVPPDVWPVLVEAATFIQMRARAERLAPDPLGIFKSRTAFFRRGTSGSGCELLTSDELAHYFARTAQMAPDALLMWLHRRDRDQAASPGASQRRSAMLTVLRCSTEPG